MPVWIIYSPVSVTVTSQYCVEIIAQIEPVFGLQASLDLSYNLTKEIWVFPYTTVLPVPNSGLKTTNFIVGNQLSQVLSIDDANQPSPVYDSECLSLCTTLRVCHSMSRRSACIAANKTCSPQPNKSSTKCNNILTGLSDHRKQICF